MVCAGNSTKDCTAITFGEELAIKKEWMERGADGIVYDLIATVLHHGNTLASGHYTVRPPLAAACCAACAVHAVLCACDQAFASSCCVLRDIIYHQSFLGTVSGTYLQATTQ